MALRIPEHRAHIKLPDSLTTHPARTGPGAVADTDSFTQSHVRAHISRLTPRVTRRGRAVNLALLPPHEKPAPIFKHLRPGREDASHIHPFHRHRLRLRHRARFPTPSRSSCQRQLCPSLLPFSRPRSASSHLRLRLRLRRCSRTGPSTRSGEHSNTPRRPAPFRSGAVSPGTLPDGAPSAFCVFDDACAVLTRHDA